MELGEDDQSLEKIPKKLFKVSQSGESGSCKIKISLDSTTDKRRKKEKEFLSPNEDAKIQVVNDGASPEFKKTTSPAVSEKCSVSINFDLNTKKLWQDLHYPYGNYTSFFRHLILLEKYWRNGDLTLAPTAGVKANSYLKSVQNRIRSYEERQYASKEDLSACTRPDLGTPAAPQLIHVPGEAVLANLPAGSPSPVLRSPDHMRSPETSGTILKIPRVPRSVTSTPVSSSSDQGPKIRVRQDLMNHLGLVAAPAPGVSSSPVTPARPETSVPGGVLRSALTVTPVMATPSPSHHSTPNLAKLLSDGPSSSSAHQSADNSSDPPADVPLKSSNSQLFKSTESTSAIPLTFNNSIAEVLAAANKAKQKSREPSPKPEITITAKSSNKTKELSQVLGSSNKTASGSHKLPATITTSPSPSGGGLSIMKKQSAAGSSPLTSISPISNMTKLLQSQTPSLPPHIIAQQTLSTKPVSKPKPPGPVMSNLRPVQGSKVGAGQGIQTVNKKSLNTVLDRLGGLGTSSAPVKSSNNSLASSLVQQLQAPPMTSRPSPKTVNKAQSKTATPSLVTSLTSGPPIAQPMVQFPDASNLLQQSLLLGPNPAAAQAALMMAGLNGLSPVQAQQAMQEILQQQQQLLNQPPQLMVNPQQPPRLRAPPPLKNMAMKKPE